MIMSSSIGYLTSRSTFLQVSPEIPITKSRNPDKFDPPEVFEGEPLPAFRIPALVPHPHLHYHCYPLSSSRPYGTVLLTRSVTTRLPPP